MTEALEACARERTQAIAAAEARARVQTRTLGGALQEADRSLAAAAAEAAALQASVDAQLREQAAALRREAAEAKQRATALLVAKEADLQRLTTAPRAAGPASGVAPSAAAAAALRKAERAAEASKKQSARLRAERDEWHLRCVELHHSLRVATGGAELDGASGKSADAAERIVEVAKQQAAREKS